MNKKTLKPIPSAVAAYWMEAIYGAWLKVNKIDPLTRNTENFKKTYIDDGKKLAQADILFYLKGLMMIHDDILIDPQQCGYVDKTIFSVLHNIILVLSFHLKLQHGSIPSIWYFDQCKSDPDFNAIYQDARKIYPSLIASK